MRRNLTNIEEGWLDRFDLNNLDELKELLLKEVSYKYFQLLYLKEEDCIYTFYGGNDVKEIWNDPDIKEEKFLCEVGQLIKGGLFKKHIDTIKSLLWEDFKKDMLELDEFVVTLVLNKEKKILKTNKEKFNSLDR